MKKIVLGLVFVSLFLGACSSNENSASAKSNKTTESSLRKEVSDLKSENEELNKRVKVLTNMFDSSSTEESSDESTESVDGNVKIGDSVEFSSGENITITEVKADDSISLNDAEEGEHPVKVTAIVENKTSEPLYFNAQRFDLYDGNDELSRFDSSTYSNNMPNQIAGGKKATVIIHFGSKGNAPYSATYGDATWSE